MTETRVQLQTIVQSQLPEYVRSDFPLIADFLKEYYRGQEYQGAPIDLINNIDQYTKVDNVTNLSQTAILQSTVSSTGETLFIDPIRTRLGTQGFPDKYGLLKIGNEIISYTGKTDFSFTGCIRGFSGVSDLTKEGYPEEVVFERNIATSHLIGSEIQNLSVLFLNQILKKIKAQYAPGFQNRQIAPQVNQNVFVKQSADFYATKGTEESYKILFKVLFNEDVTLVNLSDRLFRPSDAHYIQVESIIVEQEQGDPFALANRTLFQDFPNRSYAPIAYVESISSGIGKTYYKLDIDSGYDRDVSVKGVVYGNFESTPKTRVTNTVGFAQTFIDVDSTVGFGATGTLTIDYNDGTFGEISYGNKNLTQFLNCDFAPRVIPSASEIRDSNIFAYANDGQVKVRINKILKGVKTPAGNKYYQKDNIAQIKTFGIIDDSFRASKWITNIRSVYTTKKIEVVDLSDNSYRIDLNNIHLLTIGDTIEVVSNAGTSVFGVIASIINDRSVVIFAQSSVNISTTINSKIRRVITKTVAANFPEVEINSTDVQNVYKDVEEDCFLVASGSLPTYKIQKQSPIKNFAGSFEGETYNIENHGFYTGDKVYYTPEIVGITSFVGGDYTVPINVDLDVEKSKIFNSGEYFAYRIDKDNIKFAKSIQDIYYSIKNPESSKFVSTASTTVRNNTLVREDFYNKKLKHQEIFRKFDKPSEEVGMYPTEPGYTGLLINGVEILNYKSKEKVYHGKLENIKVLSSDRNFDIISPPDLTITDDIGVGATGYLAVSGDLEEIRLLDRGFDYEEVPIVTITGGNGSGANVQVSMKSIDHIEKFDSRTVNISTDSIGFTTFHKFRDLEEVTYLTNASAGISTLVQKAVAGLTTNSQYIIKRVDSSNIKLHTTLASAVAGINTVNLTALGDGIHAFRSINKKSIVDSINVLNSGDGYQNKKRCSATTGISTANNTINITAHGYESGEIIQYFGTSGTEVGGISTSIDYYVTKVSDDKFKLSTVGVGSTAKDLYYKTEEYIDLTSVGSGQHTFNYPSILVTLSGKVGVASTGTETFTARVQPIFRGQITDVHLTNNGVGYGVTDIINFERKPVISYSKGENAQLSVSILNGRITEVVVQNKGKNYISTPDLIIDGDGFGCVITPVMKNNQIDSVFVVEGGRGYSIENTTISVVSPQSNSRTKFDSFIQKWTINLWEKKQSEISPDDGFFEIPTRAENDYQYSHIHMPRALRRASYSVGENGKSLYGLSDLRFNRTEIDSTDHSPILGWAYDGNPIYGPYGYSTKVGGSAVQMKSGYIEESQRKSNRPSGFAPGFFIEDYTYYSSNDESVLDENNGRFCITPEYPNGTYAYFTTLDKSIASDGPFENYKAPVYPYIIGNKYHALPQKLNFDRSFNQDDYDLNETNYRRIVSAYNFFDKDEVYPFITIPNNLDQKIKIDTVSVGNVESVEVLGDANGENYKVGEEILFDDEGTGGRGVSAKVSFVKGKTVGLLTASQSAFTAEIYPTRTNGVYVGVASTPHQLNTLDLISISGLSTTSSKIEGSYGITVTPDIFNLVGLGSTTFGLTANTGIVTYAHLINHPLSAIRPNDVLGIGTEKLKVIAIDHDSSRVRVIRGHDGTVAIAHTVGTAVTVNQREFTFTSGFNTSFAKRVNTEYYFTPSESLGLGENLVSAGTTVTFSNPGAGATQVYIPARSIHLKNHELKTGDSVQYVKHFASDDSIQYKDSIVGTARTILENQTLFVTKIDKNFIGLSTVKVGLGTTGSFVGIASTMRDAGLMFFTNVGTGTYHSLKTVYSPLTGTVTRNLVTVSCASTHGLSSGHFININAEPTASKTYNVRYNDYHRKLLVNTKSFTQDNVNESTDTITIENHDFESGQKVIHENDFVTGATTNNGIFYIVKIDADNFKLSKTKFDALSDKPTIVGLASTSGTINPVNPRLNSKGNSSIIFDLSDSSLSYAPTLGDTRSAFRFNLYSDDQFINRWEKSDFENPNLNFSISGKIGVNATATLNVDSLTPENLYYGLVPIQNQEGILPEVKKEYEFDSEVNYNSSIQISKSLFDGRHQSTVVGLNTFTYTVKDFPERVSYAASEATLSYITDCTHTHGPIALVSLKNKGSGYKALPGISTVDTSFGKNAVLEAKSSNIGAIETVEVLDFGFDFPHDSTLKPTVYFPQILKIEPFSKIQSIGITSFGKGYVTKPKLVVIDGVSGSKIDDIDLEFSLNSATVNIIQNTYGINATEPTIIPTRGGNGVSIKNIEYNSSTRVVTVTLNTIYSSGDTFPFTVGDKVLIEDSVPDGVAIGVGTDKKGFNSSEYDFRLFTLVGVDTNRGGIDPTVTINMESELEAGTTLAGFDTINSSAKIVSEKDFMTFNVTLTNNDYIVGEKVSIGVGKTIVGTVDGWRGQSGVVRVSSKDEFKANSTLTGETSKSRGFVADILSPFIGEIDFTTSVKNVRGFQEITGFISNDLQRTPNNEYYQNFSYSLKTRVPFQTWNDPVSSLNHPLGYKKFADYEILSRTISETSKPSASVRSSYLLSIKDIISNIDLNCVNFFDLVSENSFINANNEVVSTEVVFSSRIIKAYEEAVGNRVLKIDDFSGTFNDVPRVEEFTVINEFSPAATRAQRYHILIRDRRFTSERQFSTLDVIHDNVQGYTNEYGIVETTANNLGFFDFAISGGVGEIRFFPVAEKALFNDYNIVYFNTSLDDNFLGVGSTNIGNLVSIASSSTTVAGIGTTTIVSIGKSMTSMQVMVSVNPDISVDEDAVGEFEFANFNICHDGSTIAINEYGKLSTTPTSIVGSGLGTYHAYFSGDNLNIDFIPTATGIGTTGAINTVTVGLATNSFTGVGTIFDKHGELNAVTTTIASSGTPGIHTIASYKYIPINDEIHAAKYLIQVSDTTNNNKHFVEAVNIDTINAVGVTSECYFTEYAETVTSSGLGTFGTRLTSDLLNIELVFTPNPNIAVVTNVLQSKLKVGTVNEDPDQYNLSNGLLKWDAADYIGTQNDVKTRFPLKHNGLRIFERSFDGSSSSTITTDDDTITLPDHFFVTGEKVSYRRHDANDVESAIGCASTTFTGIGETTFVPHDTENLFIVKINDNKVKLALSAEDALAQPPVTIDLNNVGTGNSHRIVTTNQDSRVILTIDNVIQSPIVGLAITTSLTNELLLSTSDIIKTIGITSFFAADTIQIDDEIIKLQSIGVGTEPNAIRVRRGRLGTQVVNHSANSLITKVAGNYKITDNMVNFIDPPFGIKPQTSSDPDEQDWTGIQTGSSFYGRSFMRGPVASATTHTYTKNYVIDDVSHEFDAVQRDFQLTSNRQTFSGISDDNAVVLINNVFQPPLTVYNITEPAGINSLSFIGNPDILGYDVGVSSMPRGGIIQSIGSTEGLGYQPLISAGGTATVSGDGTVSGVNVSQIGSGYRAQEQFEISTRVNHPIAIGDTTIYLGNVNSVFDILSLVNDGTNCKVSIGTEAYATPIVSVGNTFVTIGTGATLSSAVAGGTLVSIAVTNPPMGIVNVSAATSFISQGTLPGLTYDVLDAIYNPQSGFMVMTLPKGHEFNQGDYIRLKDNGLYFTCASDNNTAIKSYPRPNLDYNAWQKSLKLAKVSDQDVTVFVGLSTFRYFDVSHAVYNHANGDLTLSIGDHNFVAGRGISLADDSLTFTCALDGHTAQKTYPRTGAGSNDYAYQRTLDITGVAGTTITVNVHEVPGNPVSSGGIHTFVSATSNAVIAGGQYAHTFTGIATAAIIGAASTSKQHIGFATVVIGTGRISTDVTVTNPGFGLTFANMNLEFDQPRPYSNVPVIYSADSPNAGVGTFASVNIIVGNGSSIRDVEMVNLGYRYGNNEILTVPTGGLTGIPTSGSFREFQISVDRTHGDTFNSWSIGQLQLLDNLESYIDGRRKLFQLFLGGDSISIIAAPNSNINIEDTLLIFINDVLQIPNDSYIFKGGSTIRFLEAPRLGDKMTIIFYKGNGDSDVRTVDIVETVKSGDSLKITDDNPILTEDRRTVSDVPTSDIAVTLPYYGPGNIEDPNIQRSVVWCRQTEDMLIDNKLVSKARVFYEPNITPNASLINSVGIGSTVFYCDSIRPIFNQNNESSVSLDFQNKVNIYKYEVQVGASATATVSAAGTISGLTLTNAGEGYGSVIVSIASTVGIATTSTTATATGTVGASGTISALTVTSGGVGYSTITPPAVLISPPSITKETVDVFGYSGDEGRVVGIATTMVGTNFHMVFDLYLPDNAFNDIINVSTALTVTQLSQGDYFKISNSNIGAATTSIKSFTGTGTTIGIGTQFFDNVYYANNVMTVIKSVAGVSTAVKRIQVRVQDNFPAGYDFTTNSGMTTLGEYFGDYSWGKVIIESRTVSTAYTGNTSSGVGGLSTSPQIIRFAPLKYTNYSGLST